MRSARVALIIIGLFAFVNGGPQNAQTNLQDLPHGPLVGFPSHGNVVEDEHVGRVFTDSFEIVSVDGNEPVVLDKLVMNGQNDGLEYLGAMVAGPSRTSDQFQYMKDYPPRLSGLGTLVPLHGATLLPRSQYQSHADYDLLIGFKRILPAPTLRSGIWVVYHVGGKEYADYLEAKLVTCSANMSDRACLKDVGIQL